MMADHFRPSPGTYEMRCGPCRYISYASALDKAMDQAERFWGLTGGNHWYPNTWESTLTNAVWEWKPHDNP